RTAARSRLIDSIDSGTPYAIIHATAPAPLRRHPIVAAFRGGSRLEWPEGAVEQPLEVVDERVASQRPPRAFMLAELVGKVCFHALPKKRGPVVHLRQQRRRRGE